MNDLFSKTKIGNIRLKNHFVKSATYEGRATFGGHLTPYIFRYYEHVAKGGAGLIITSFARILKNEKAKPKMIGIYEDSFISEYKKLVKLSHKHGTKIVMQISYGGNQTKTNTNFKNIFSPSGIACMKNGSKGTPISAEKINWLTDKFAQAALRAKNSGFDGVQIHAAHGYFLSQFLTPKYNRRIDKYGGNLENRSRIIFDVYNKIRKAVGKNFSVMIKINCEDFVKDGFKLNECIYVCKKLSALGIDAIEVSGGVLESRFNSFSKPNILEEKDEAIFKKQTMRIARAIKNTPIIMSGGLRSLNVIENIYKNSGVNFFSLARPLISEPDLIKRWEQGKRGKSRCISCRNCFGKNDNGNYYCVLDKK